MFLLAGSRASSQGELHAGCPVRCTGPFGDPWAAPLSPLLPQSPGILFNFQLSPQTALLPTPTTTAHPGRGSSSKSLPPPPHCTLLHRDTPVCRAPLPHHSPEGSWSSLAHPNPSPPSSWLWSRHQIWGSPTPPHLGTQSMGLPSHTT